MRNQARVIVTSALLAAVALTTSGTAAKPPSPIALTAIFRDAPDDTVRGDGSPYLGFREVSGSLDGAYISSAGALDINLVPESVPLDHAMKFFFGSPLVQGNAPDACAPPSVLTARRVDFRFNIVGADGRQLGIQAMGLNGVPWEISSGGVAGYDIVGIINFLPDDAPSTVTNFALRFDGVDGTTLSRSTDLSSWTLSSNADVRLQCAARTPKPPQIYDVGIYHMRFELAASK